LLKRSKTDDEIVLEAAAGTSGGSVLVLNDDRDACELIARLVESAGWEAVRSYDFDDVAGQLAQGQYIAAVIDSMSCGITVAFRVLDEIRKAPEGRNLGVVILAATDTIRLFACQSGVDGYVVRPVHADEFLDVMRLVLSKSSEERLEFRRAQLMGGATTA
jgi:DNA-binding response OmpR family regulator